MVKHTQTIRRQFVISALKGLSFWQMYFIWYLYLGSFTDATANWSKIFFLPLRLKFYVQFRIIIISIITSVQYNYFKRY